MTATPNTFTADDTSTPITRIALGRLGDVGGHRWHRLAELVALNGLIAQPVLGVFGESPETLVVTGAGRLDVLLFVTALLLAGPLVVWIVELLAGLVRNWMAGLVHVGAVSALFAVYLAELASVGFEWTGPVAIAGGVILALITTAIYVRFTVVSTWLAWMAIGPLLFAGLFFFGSPASQVVAGSDATTAGAAGSQTDVVVIVLDELPLVSLLDGQGDIDRDRFPNIARLIDDSTWYRNSTSPVDATEWAAPVIATGRYPTEKEVAPTPGNHAQSVFSLLGGSHTMEVSEALPLCPSNVCQQPPAGSAARALLRLAGDVFVDQFRADVQPLVVLPHLDAVDQSTRFDRYSERIVTASPEPTLFFLHSVLPHAPYQLLADGTLYDDPDPQFGLRVWPFIDWASPSSADLGRQRHLHQTMATDRLVGDLLDALEASDRYDDSLVVLTADHGIAFDAMLPMRRAVPETLSQLAWIPLVIKLPNQEVGVIDDRNASLVDIVPTIAAVIETDIPWAVDGVSLLGEPRADQTKRYHYWNRPLEEEIPKLNTPGTELYGHQIVEDFDGSLYFPALLDHPRWGTATDPFRTEWADEWLRTPVNIVDQMEVRMVEGSIHTPDRPMLDPASGESLPLMVTGDFSNPAEWDPDTWLAIAVNGRIAGFSGVFDTVPFTVDPLQFGALTPPDLHHEGTNSVEIFAVMSEREPTTPLLLQPLTFE